MEQLANDAAARTPWNKGKLVGQKAPLKLKEIWAIRIRLQLEHRARELALFNLAIDSNPTPAPMDCSTGPVQRAYGGSDWLVYSCADHRSIVVVSAPGSRAGPFYFMLNATASGHNIVGEGNGDRTMTDRAYDQLAALSEADLNQLVAQTRAQPKK
jgi:hypothetical protein